MWDWKILGIDFYYIVHWFFIYSFFGWLMESTYAVSYTHLDVYKRQGKGLSLKFSSRELYETAIEKFFLQSEEGIMHRAANQYMRSTGQTSYEMSVSYLREDDLYILKIYWD